MYRLRLFQASNFQLFAYFLFCLGNRVELSYIVPFLKISTVCVTFVVFLGLEFKSQ